MPVHQYAMIPHMRRFLLSITLALLAGCNGPSGRDRATLYVHLSADPGTLNPILSNEGVASAINNNIYENLIDRDYDSLDIVPQLAERWEITPDRLRYRFHLKRGVLWSDGREFTADDVVYSFNLIKNPATACAPLKVYYLDVQSARAIDKYTVEFRYSRPYYLGLEVCGEIPIVPRHIFSKGDFNRHPNNRHPVGTGPYRFERWDTGKKVVLTRNERYRGARPALERIVYQVIMEDTIALKMLKKGDLDVMSVRPIHWVRQTTSRAFTNRFYKLMYYLPNYSYIGWNAERPYFADPRVRRALTMLIDRHSILNKLNFGLGKIVTGTFYINSRAYSPEISPWAFDPAAARRLLEEAGWKDRDGDGILEKDGKKFTFIFTIPSASKSGERLTTILKEDFSRAGIDMKILRYEWAVFVGKLERHDFDAVYLSWALGYSDDPYQLWHSTQVKGGSNFCSFKNKEVDRIIEKARVEFNARRRDDLYHRFNRIIHDEQPYTFLFCNPALVVVSKRFGNVKMHTRGLNYLEWTLGQP